MAYEKAHNPKTVLEECNQTLQRSYRRWVYKREALLNNALVQLIGVQVQWTNYKRKGYWTDQTLYPTHVYCKGGKATFSGIVATPRVFRGERGKYVTFPTLGIGNGEYIDVTLHSHKAQCPFGSPGHGF